MKNITNKIFEANQRLVSEVQNEFDKDYAYQTFKYSDGQKKYKYGFLVFDCEQEFYSITAFNEDSEDAENFATQYDRDLEELEELEIGDSLEDHTHGDNYIYIITRIW